MAYISFDEMAKLYNSQESEKESKKSLKELDLSQLQEQQPSQEYPYNGVSLGMNYISKFLPNGNDLKELMVSGSLTACMSA